MNNLTLREIEVDFLALEDLLCEAQGEISPIIADWMIEVERNLESKAVGYVFATQKLSALAEMNRAFAKQYTERARVLENAEDQIKDRLKLALQNMNITEVKGKGATIKLCGAPPRVDVHNEKLIPTDFFRVELILDKKKISEALKSGEAVPGARLLEGSSLRLKMEVK